MNGETVESRYERGLARMYELGGRPVTDGFLAGLADVCPALGEHIVSFIYGHLHHRPGLTPAERELVTLAVLATLGGCEREVRLHTKGALGPACRRADHRGIAGGGRLHGCATRVNAVLAPRKRSLS